MVKPNLEQKSVSKCCFHPMGPCRPSHSLVTSFPFPRECGHPMDKQPGATWSPLTHHISAGWPHLGELQPAHVNAAQVRRLLYAVVLQLEHSADGQLSRLSKFISLAKTANVCLWKKAACLVQWKEPGLWSYQAALSVPHLWDGHSPADFTGVLGRFLVLCSFYGPTSSICLLQNLYFWGFTNLLHLP